MQQSAILSLQNATKQFAGNTEPAVDRVSLTLPHGDILGLVGPSGCGKTTLLRLVAGFESPDRGSIEIAGRVVASRQHWIPPEQRDIGIVFQDYALFPHMNVRDNVGFGLRSRNPERAKQRIAEILALVGLEALAKRYPHELSGGQQQRIALARALAPQPKLILLDEPLSNLDIQVRLRLREEVRDILKATGISAIFVTHDQEEALAISDLVGVMRHGCVEQLGLPEEIYTNPASRFIAEFVTQANFFPAKRKGQLWETEVGCFEVRNADSIGDIGELMIRQEDVILKPADRASVFIRSRRFLGREYRYCLQTASGKEMHVRTATNIVFPVGMRVDIAIASNTIRIFPRGE
jgi:iron(III) transport system ATP-binding protein